MIEDFVEINENGERHTQVYRKTNTYLTAGTQYYARFAVQTSYAEYDDYPWDEEEYNVTISEYTGVTITDADLIEVFEGENILSEEEPEEADDGDFYVQFTPRESGRYVFSTNGGICTYTDVYDCELWNIKEDLTIKVKGYQDFELYELEAGRTYLISSSKRSISGGLKIRKYENPVSVEGSILVADYYLCGNSGYSSEGIGEWYENSREINYSFTLTYADGKQTTITQDNSSDDYGSFILLDMTLNGEVVRENIHLLYNIRKTGNYKLRATLGGQVVSEVDYNIVSVSEFAKGFQNIPFNQSFSVNEGELYAFVAPKDNHYDFSKSCLIGFENEDGSAEWYYYSSDDYKAIGFMKAGQSCLISYYEACTTKIYEHHYYVDSYCAVCGKVRMLATPKLTGVETTQNGVRIQWEKVTNAPLYRVYRKIGTGSWTRIGDVSQSTSRFYDDTAPAGQVCYYTVRCLSADKKSFLSDYDHTGLANIYLTSPELTVANAASGVNISWTQSKGAKGYIVYRKTSTAILFTARHQQVPIHELQTSQAEAL